MWSEAKRKRVRKVTGTSAGWATTQDQCSCTIPTIRSTCDRFEGRTSPAPHCRSKDTTNRTTSASLAPAALNQVMHEVAWKVWREHPQHTRHAQQPPTEQCEPPQAPTCSRDTLERRDHFSLQNRITCSLPPVGTSQQQHRHTPPPNSRSLRRPDTAPRTLETALVCFSLSNGEMAWIRWTHGTPSTELPPRLLPSPYNNANAKPPAARSST